ncbi:O-antigen translocase [Dysgonomonas sp. Marseille-P4677]|uniref:O-antigen translocase n=1 Tax=Dysgonomonas sp. Marseille-P4677 TaxID=2364790 RepID=UPI0019127074|nr:O-antigen translocase [Dysgonomonas sp. Marseille-P4677]MBK5720814.1 O-antigen translocase [Dysgonomonas sp. Marseille-P4677]
MKKNNKSYNQILKSTTIFGGSQVLVVLIGIIRTKIIAILLGTTGVGIIGIYYSIVDMVRSGAGLGIDTAGVREVAEVDSQEDKTLLYKTIRRYNIWFKLTALIGLLLCIAFCYPISVWAFGDNGYAFSIACLSICVFCAILTTGRSTLLQGMRRISYLAKSNIIASIVSLIITIPLYSVWGIEAIAITFILTYLASFICVEFYYRKLRIPKVDISIKESFRLGLKPLKLGFFIVIGGFISTLSMFLVKAYITRNIGIDAAGLFQSAWVITNIYLGLILRSMGSDFFPRLSAIANDRSQVKTLVNEQSYVVLVIASPIIVGMLLFSNIAISIFYSSEFAYADTVLRWQILGTFFKVLSWPMAFIMLAKNKGFVYLFSEVLFYVVYLASTYLLFPKYGLDATGIAYFIAYIVYLLIVFIISHKLTKFGWTKNIVLMTVVNILLIGTAFFLSQYSSDNIFLLSGIILFAISILYGYYNLQQVFSLQELKDWFRKTPNNKSD